MGWSCKIEQGATLQVPSSCDDHQPDEGPVHDPCPPGTTWFAFMRVVELTSEWTRFAGRLLVGLGHQVVLVEPPADDHHLREDAIQFAHWNAGKASVVAPFDPMSDALAVLLDGADALLDGRPAAEVSDTEQVARRFPHLVHVAVTPFGRTGPSAGWAATDLTVAAAGGMLAQVGHPDTPPLQLPHQQAEQLAGANAAIGALLGDAARVRTGRGQFIDVSAQECVAASLEAGALTWIHTDEVRPRPGDTHPLVPHRLFIAADGYLAGGLGGSPRMWSPLVRWMGEHGAAQDLEQPRWDDPSERARHRDHILEVVGQFAAQWPRNTFAAEGQSRRLPWAAVQPPDELLANPQLVARDVLQEVVLGDGRVAIDLGLPFLPAAGRPTRLTVHDRGADDELLSDTRGADAQLTGQSFAPGPTAPTLDGIRVLDLTWVLAGPYATKILADHGADVIKIESSRRQDPTRFSPAMHLSRDDNFNPDASGYFNNFNRNKRSVTLDLRASESIEVSRRLVAASDVVIENFSYGVMQRMGLDYMTMQGLRDDIIYVSMSGMGHTSPWRDWVSYADTVSAASGLTAMTGWATDQVVGVIYGHGDIVAGTHAALAVLDAL